jgi:hypothetical protein
LLADIYDGEVEGGPLLHLGWFENFPVMDEEEYQRLIELNGDPPWSEEQQREAFGQTYELLDTYQDGLANPPQYFVPTLLGLVQVEMVGAGYGDVASPASGDGRAVFCNDVQAAVDAIQVILHEFRAGWERLMAMLAANLAEAQEAETRTPDYP